MPASTPVPVPVPGPVPTATPRRSLRNRPAAVPARLRVLLPALLPALLLTGGCAFGLPRPVGPAGVDGLQVPTPSPDPRDFVDRIDNPYLPLFPHTTWTYESTSTGGRITVAVFPEPEEVAGVRTTRVERTEGDRTTAGFYAQDTAGNVWSFGADAPGTAGDWLAGVDGAEAGLVMPATPRVGDGFEQQDAPGVAEGRSTVLALGVTRTTPYAVRQDLLEIEDRSALDDRVVTRFYAPGLGMVLEERDGRQWALAEHTAPPAPTS